MIYRAMVLGGALASALGTSSAFAAEPGFFIGAGGGQSTAKASFDIPPSPIRPASKVDFDEIGDTYKGYVGFNFTRWFGIEGGYVQFGDTEKKTTITNIDTSLTQVKLEVKPNGWQGFAVLYLPLGPFDIFGKVGGIVDYGSLVRKMLSAGISSAEIARFAKIVGYQVAFRICYHLGDPNVSYESFDDTVRKFEWDLL